ALTADPALLGRLAGLLLDQHFAPSLHSDLADAVGLDLTADDGARGTRRLRHGAAELRERVLAAYESRCAFCGYDGAVEDTRGRTPVGLEAAHVRWWAFAGPDDLSNGLCLCALHHKLFDKGVLGLDGKRRILVSRQFTGRSEAAQAYVLRLGGRPVLGPRAGSAPVAGEHIDWHMAQVFRGEPRVAPVSP
ncbi:phosphorothioated DNA-binding restriction endonuclease, partial [Streptomyces sp. 2MCAF27]